MVSEGMRLLGTVEVPGPGNNPLILAWAKETELDNVYRADETPWCGLFVALLVKRTGRLPVPTPLWALSWRTFGVKAATPSLGDILVFKRPGGGHVGLYIAEDAQAYHVLGGNQGNRVSITRIAKSRLVDARRPIYRAQPDTVKPYVLQASGELSNNEA